MVRTSRLWIASALVLGLTLAFGTTVPSLALAQSADGQSAGGQITDKAYVNAVKKGNKALGKGKADKALQSFEKALTVADTTEIRLLLARTHLELGQSNDAITHLTAVADQVQGDDSRAFEALLKQAGPGATQVGVTVDAGVQGATVHVDGTDAGTTDRALRVQPGRHTFRVAKAGYGSAEKKALVLPGKNTKIDMPLSRQMGTVRVKVDSAGVKVKVGDQTAALEAGQPKEFDVPVGPVTVEFTPESGEVDTRTVTVSDAVVEANYFRFGNLMLTGVDRPVKVAVADDTFDFTPGAKAIAVPAGEHTMTITGEGLTPIRGKIKMEAGKTTTVAVQMTEAPDHFTAEALGWTAIGTGFALVLATVIIEETVDFDSMADHDAVIWTMAGVGTALTITGGVTLREVYAAKTNPEVMDVEYDVQVGFAPSRTGGSVAATFRF